MKLSNCQSKIESLIFCLSVWTFRGKNSEWMADTNVSLVHDWKIHEHANFKNFRCRLQKKSDFFVILCYSNDSKKILFLFLLLFEQNFIVTCQLSNLKMHWCVCECVCLRISVLLFHSLHIVVKKKNKLQLIMKNLWNIFNENWVDGVKAW